VVELRDPSIPLARQGQDQVNVPPEEIPQYDLVLPAQGCRLEVLVTHHGKPVADAAVTVTQEPGPGLHDYIYSNGGLAHYRAERVLHPIASTNQKGVAYLTDLPAGSFMVVASDKGEAGLYSARDHFVNSNAGNVGKYRGVVLQSGQTRRFHADLAGVENKV